MAKTLLARTLAALEAKHLKAHLHNTGFRLVLHAHRNYKGHGLPRVTLSHDDMAAMLHYKTRKTPMRHVQALREAGVLDWPPPTPVGRCRSAKNTYTITLEVEANAPAQTSRCDMKAFGAPLHEKMSQRSSLERKKRDLSKENKMGDEERLANLARVQELIAALSGKMRL
jgi:hypothetical protein